MLEVRRFDPAGCNFPRPAVPLLPALRWDALALNGEGATAPAVFDGPGAHHFSRGRYALHAAYHAAGVGAAGALLAPSYHCRTMLDPALALGGRIELFALDEQLVPRIDSIRALITGATVAPRALVVPHYFGIEQPPAVMQELAQLCGQHGITLIEDCSHAWQVAAARAPLRRTTGHVFVASPYKFFACEDGGMLWGDAATPAARSAADELRALRNAFQRRSAAALPASAQDNGNRGSDLAEACAGPSGQYLRSAEGRASLALSRWVMRRTRVAPVTELRRRHYQHWSAALANVQGARVLFPQLPADCAPYMLPLLIERPDPVFFVLKQSAVPIWRWDEMGVSGCPVASRYRTHLLHLPCHQDLSAAQLTWMVAQVTKALA